MTEPISVSLLPNAFNQDLGLALRFLFSPSKWIRGREVKLLEKDFARLFPGFGVASFICGRTALLAILKSLGIGQGDEVLLQSFTCVVVANAIKKLGSLPVYVDIKKDSYNLDPADLEKKITPKSRALIVQHSFGYPAEMTKIMAIAKKYRLKLIEDCAHGIGAEFKGQKLGTFGQAAFFSFGRDKVISSVFGGMAITGDKKLLVKIRDFQDRLPYPAGFFVFRQLLYQPLFAWLLGKYYFFSLGKIFLVVLQKFKIFLKAVAKEEKKGLFPTVFLARLPNSLAGLARLQLKRLPKFNQTRKKITRFYGQNLSGLPIKQPNWQIEGKPLPLLRFTIQTNQAQDLYRFAKKQGIILNNWYYPPVSPPGVDCLAVNYQPVKCPVAEKVAARVVNLPTHPKMTLKKAQRVVETIKVFLRDQGLL
jgi:perosamine synthetase